MDCADDFVVAGAAAEVVGEVEADLVLGRIGVLVEQGFGGDEEAGRTDAALQGGAFQKALLERVQVAVLGEAFDRFDLGPFGFDREDQAAVHRQAVHEHGARAAVAVVAAFLRAGQVQRIAEHLQEALPRLAEEFGGFAVDGRGDVGFGHERREW